MITGVNYIIPNLKHYALMADQERTPLKAGESSPSSPYFMTTLLNSAHSDDGKIVAIQVGTTEGVPFELAMSPEQALETIAALQRELDHIGGARPVTH